MRIHPGTGDGLRPGYVARSAVSGIQQLGVGLWSSAGAPDTVVWHSDGSLTRYPGNLWVFPRTSSGLGSRRLLARAMCRFDLMD